MEHRGPGGRIFNIQHFCLHDGPGIRTTLFLKGCPLRCVWCHNPEGAGKEKLLSFDPLKCRGCGACVRVCPAVHKIGEQGRFLDRSACSRRGECVGVCVSRALELIGRDVRVEDILGELVQDKPFYNTSGGGVTLSGGEPAMQGEFLLDLAARLKEKEVHVALETSGFCDFAVLKALLPFVDIFLYDYKETDPELHRQFTGVSNTLILENLEKLSGAGAKILLRCPIIPGLNDRDDHFRGIAALSRAYLHMEGVELLPYHNLGSSKAERLGLAPGKRYTAPAETEKTRWVDTVRAYGGKIAG